MKQASEQESKAAGMTCEMAQRAIALGAMTVREPEDGSADYLSAGEPDSDRLDALFVAEMERELVSAGPGAEPEWKASSAESIERAFAGKGKPFPSDIEPASAQTISTGHPEQDALAAHLAGCADCRAEAAATTAFFRALAHEDGPEPSANLLARARTRLDERLDSSEHASFWARTTQWFAFTAGRLRAAPVLCSGLLLAGLAVGGYGGYRAGHAAHDAEQTALLLGPPRESPTIVADVSFVHQDPATGMVEVRYDRLAPDGLTARPDDPSIRELLLVAIENGIDPQVRDTSLNLLAGSCSPGAPCSGASMRNALLTALETDKTPEVRRQAMAGLQPFIAEDMVVRDAVLQALMSDPSASVRSEAVKMLQPVDVDSSVRQVLHTVASHDGDPAIRTASMEALQSLPAVQ